ncbi:MAG: hypothetical protein U0840_30060 [Gemmataceae bacterium]
MPSLHIPDATFEKLVERAAALNVTVEELVRPALEQLTQNGATNPQLPLTGEAWKRELEAWKKDAASRADRYPPGHILNDSRETIYGEREDSQF